LSLPRSRRSIYYLSLDVSQNVAANSSQNEKSPREFYASRQTHNIRQKPKLCAADVKKAPKRADVDKRPAHFVDESLKTSDSAPKFAFCAALFLKKRASPRSSVKLSSLILNETTSACQVFLCQQGEKKFFRRQQDIKINKTVKLFPLFPVAPAKRLLFRKNRRDARFGAGKSPRRRI
jgi:hypothetical protein